MALSGGGEGRTASACGVQLGHLLPDSAFSAGFRFNASFKISFGAVMLISLYL